MKIKIGLIGEDPNDTKAIAHLMKGKFDFHYKTISKNQRGSKMFNESALKSYNLELSTTPYACVIVIVDADAIATESAKIQEKKKQYAALDKQLKCKSLLLLNIYELEALILADSETVSQFYNTEFAYTKNVVFQEKPKEFLQHKTGNKYKVSHCPELFQSLNFDTVRENCSYFNAFISDFEKAITN